MRSLELCDSNKKSFIKKYYYFLIENIFRKNIFELEKFKNFQWLGALEYPEKVRQFLSEIDVCALLSGIDMSPLTLQEAQLMQKPVVATNVGGIPELMRNNETGFLTKKGDHDELFKKLEILINDEKISQKMSRISIMSSIILVHVLVVAVSL